MTIPPRRRRAAIPDLPGRREQSMRRLLDAAETILAEQGYENASVSEIASRAGVSPSLINAYFLGKAGLCYAVVQRHNAPQFDAFRAAAESNGTAAERLGRMIATIVAMDLEKPRLYAALQALSWAWPVETERQNRAEIAPFLDLVARVAADGAARGEFRPLPAGEVGEIFLAVYTFAIRDALFAAEAPGAVARRILDRMLLLLAPPPG
ncbi:TetR/AcrR family transcriptional regulator [Roseomonas sp. PWR1]|uniref:TetR/AcrR family transcriptional regulator n=1 Tax=Roseomonas nitratireducens TaxID=2820810 RepID=A0ABS4AUW6_9PROT|nr:TetR/AcrR family transcriptional regulator [Neoroseomonas nitratireducens]MBP0465158.1 TetR/AcrR family transcriptional regulator [Neoroseomonas nitratireducens]